MKSYFSSRGGAPWPAVVRAGIALLSLGVSMGSSSAWAAPPAFSMIGNQATASYLDGNGTNQRATSNMVQTQVQQVGSFTLDSVSTVTTTVVNTKTGGSGNVVYAPHIITNTGNGTDNFNIVITNGPNGTPGMMPTAVYADADGNGMPDSTTALCSAAAGATCTVPAQTVAGNGGVFKFLVAYNIPASATAAVPYSSGTTTVTPATTSLYTAPNNSAADVDNVNVTTAAAFSANLSLAIPAVTAPDGQDYPAAPTSGKHSTIASCGTTMSAARAPVAGCVYTTYTLNFSNTGGGAGAFYANNILPAGFTYVTGSAVWSGASGTALGEGAGADPVGIDYVYNAPNMSARVANVNANVSGSISFMVLVNSTAMVGTTNTTGKVTYDTVTSAQTTANGATGSATTNVAAYTVTPTYGVVLGSSAGAVVASADTTAGTPQGVAGTVGADQNVADFVTSGSTVMFTQTVFNTGDVADTFNLRATTNSFPAGSNITYFNMDGVTSLLDTNGDNVVDTGAIAVGGLMKFVVQVQIPPTTPTASANYALVIRATSSGDSTKLDASGNLVKTVGGILLDLTNTLSGMGTGYVGNGDLGAGPSPLPTVTNTTPAGTGSIFQLFIRNGEKTQSNTFNLDVSQSATFPGSLPTGWTVKFVAMNATCAGSPITLPVTVTANSAVQVDACVTPPSSAPSGVTSVYFRAVSTAIASSGVIVRDSLQDALTVTAPMTFQSTLTPNHTGQVTPGGTVVYAHNLTNTGAQTCGNYTLTASQSNAGSGWTNAIYLDNNNNGILDAGDTIFNGSSTGPAVKATTKFLVRVFAPAGSTTGQSDTVTLNVAYTDPAASNCGNYSVQDISTVAVGQVRAVMTQVLNVSCDNAASAVFAATLITNAKPGHCISYQIVAINEGLSPVSSLSISDAMPNFTTLSGTQPTAQCAAGGGATGTPLFTSAGSTVNCGTATSVPPGGTLTMRFTAQITN